MLNRYLKSNRGSALVMVLVTLSILSMLGTALISLSVINYKMKIIDRNVKTSMYLAEAGLEEAYAAIGKVIEAGIEAGNNKVDTELPVFINSQRELEQFDPELDESVYIEGADGYGAVNEVEIKAKIVELFKDGYKTYINNNLKALLEEKSDNNDYTVADTSINNLPPQVTVLNPSNPSHEDYLTEFSDTSDKYKISLQSDYTYNNVEKQLKARFTIDIPAYNSPYYVRNVMSKMGTNVLMKKAITTEKDIFINGDNVTINGDIYAYGTEPANKTEARLFGGIVVGERLTNKSGEVKINGNVATSSYIHANADDSSIEINGDVFANSLVIQEDTENSRITVSDGSVNTQDDIELNGEKGTITINGSYYGFSDGSYSSAEHYESSSIVINSPDIGNDNGSSITITGNVFLGGTVYIQVTGLPYQTGESVSLRGNYLAYSDYLSNDGDKYSDLDEDRRDEKFKPDNVIMKNYPPLVLIDKYREDGEIKDFNSIEKSEYFRYFNEDHPDELNLGGDGGIYLSNVLHSTGAFISENIINKSTISVDHANVFERKNNDFLFYINKMWDSQYGDHQSLDDLDDRIFISDRFDFGSTNIPSQSDVNNKKEIIYINNSNTDLALVGPNSSFTPSAGANIIDLNDDYLQGIIIIKGDLFISGEINFRGMIACEGNIYFEDDNPKVINNDLEYVTRKVSELDGSEGSYDLKDQFINNNPNEEYHFLVESEAGKDDTESYLKYENIVDIRWDKIK